MARRPGVTSGDGRVVRPSDSRSRLNGDGSESDSAATEAGESTASEPAVSTTTATSDFGQELGGVPAGDADREVDPAPAEPGPEPDPDPPPSPDYGQELGGDPAGDADRSVDPAPTEPEPEPDPEPAPSTGGSSGGLGGDPAGDTDRDVDPAPAEPDPTPGGSSGGVGGDPAGDADRDVDPEPTEPDPEPSTPDQPRDDTPSTGGSSGGLGGDPAGDADRGAPTETPTGDPSQQPPEDTRGAADGLRGDPVDPREPAEQREFVPERRRGGEVSQERVMAATRARRAAVDEFERVDDPADVAVDLDRTDDGWQASYRPDAGARAAMVVSESPGLDSDDVTTQEGEVRLTDQGRREERQQRRDAINNLLNDRTPGVDATEPRTIDVSAVSTIDGRDGGPTPELRAAVEFDDRVSTVDVGGDQAERRAADELETALDERRDFVASAITLGAVTDVEGPDLGPEDVDVTGTGARREVSLSPTGREQLITRQLEQRGIDPDRARFDDQGNLEEVSPDTNIIPDDQDGQFFGTVANAFEEQVADRAAAGGRFAYENVVVPTASFTGDVSQGAIEFATPGVDTSQYLGQATGVGGEDSIEDTVTGTVEGAGSLVTTVPAGLPNTALRAGKVGGEATRFAVENPDEAPGAAVDTTAAFAQDTVQTVADNPARTTGSLVGSGAIFRAASAVGPRASLGTRAAIQPGEELLGYGGGAVTRRLGRGERLFPNNEPIIFSEEAAIRGVRGATDRAREAAGSVRDVASEADARTPSVRLERLPESDTGLVDVDASLSDRIRSVAGPNQAGRAVGETLADLARDPPDPRGLVETEGDMPIPDTAQEAGRRIGRGVERAVQPGEIGREVGERLADNSGRGVRERTGDAVRSAAATGSVIGYNALQRVNQRGREFGESIADRPSLREEGGAAVRSAVATGNVLAYNAARGANERGRQLGERFADPPAVREQVSGAVRGAEVSAEAFFRNVGSRTQAAGERVGREAQERGEAIGERVREVSSEESELGPFSGLLLGGELSARNVARQTQEAANQAGRRFGERVAAVATGDAFREVSLRVEPGRPARQDRGVSVDARMVEDAGSPLDPGGLLDPDRLEATVEADVDGGARLVEARTETEQRSGNQAVIREQRLGEDARAEPDRRGVGREFDMRGRRRVETTLPDGPPQTVDPTAGVPFEEAAGDLPGPTESAAPPELAAGGVELFDPGAGVGFDDTFGRDQRREPAVEPGFVPAVDAGFEQRSRTETRTGRRTEPGFEQEPEPGFETAQREMWRETRRERAGRPEPESREPPAPQPPADGFAAVDFENPIEGPLAALGFDGFGGGGNPMPGPAAFDNRAEGFF